MYIDGWVFKEGVLVSRAVIYVSNNFPMIIPSSGQIRAFFYSTEALAGFIVSKVIISNYSPQCVLPDIERQVSAGEPRQFGSVLIMLTRSNWS